MNTILEKSKPENTNSRYLRSSLYNLMAALNEEVDFKNDDLVTETVLDMIRSKKILWEKKQTPGAV
jgi:hypothetical protein